MTTPNKQTTPVPSGIIVDLPATCPPKLVIPRSIAEEWAVYSMIALDEYKAEWGCAVRVQPSDDGTTVFVKEYKPYKINATAAYWENIEGERQRHMQELIDAGREEEIPEWNAMFHSHPAGMSARMSGTDIKQLRELAEPNWWGISIIAPATREGIVAPDKWMYHYAEARYFGGSAMLVSNKVPTITLRAEADDVKEKREQMKEIMVKPTPPAKKNFPGWNGSGNRTGFHSPNTSVPQLERTTGGDNEMLIGTDMPSLETPIKVGDWVEVILLDMTPSATALLTQQQIKELRAYEGKAFPVKAVNQGGQINVGKWWLSPAYIENFPNYDGDLVEIIAYAGTPKARHLTSLSRHGRVSQKALRTMAQEKKAVKA